MSFKPFPPGTVRGPFQDGHGRNPNRGGVCFMVQTQTGWVPFTGPAHEEGEVCKRAHDYAAEVTQTHPESLRDWEDTSKQYQP